jgi:signal peptidase I
MLDCHVEEVAKSEGELWLEVGKGVDRFQARFDLSTGQCSLVRRGETEEATLATQATVMHRSGTHHVRFANFDRRLTLWMDGQLPFADGVDYEAPRQTEPAPEQDVSPIRIGGRSASVRVSHLRIWRDTYYTAGSFNQETPRFFHVHPGHYFCLGDNSPESSDSRFWGLVPAENVMGRATMIYWPWSRMGAIH